MEALLLGMPHLDARWGLDPGAIVECLPPRGSKQIPARRVLGKHGLSHHAHSMWLCAGPWHRAMLCAVAVTHTTVSNFLIWTVRCVPWHLPRVASMLWYSRIYALVPSEGCNARAERYCHGT